MLNSSYEKIHSGEESEVHKIQVRYRYPICEWESIATPWTMATRLSDPTQLQAER